MEDFQYLYITTLNETLNFKLNQMAKLLQADGITRVGADVSTLESMQKLVGGYIEMVHLNDGQVLVCNEEGLLYGLPFNINASELAGLQIVGDAILCDRNEIR
jgi:hypothetical protein|tara:strand:+ start:1520 stop:1828 length:309 start_codon:yes stop_codon:yes gene_type:complete